jgi:hypothetical protein
LFAADRAIVFGELLSFEVERGIDDRLWGPAPERPLDDESDEPSEARDVESALAAVGLETADLFALDDDGADDQETIVEPVKRPVKAPRRNSKGGPRRPRGGKR